MRSAHRKTAAIATAAGLALAVAACDDSTEAPPEDTPTGETEPDDTAEPTEPEDEGTEPTEPEPGEDEPEPGEDEAEPGEDEDFADEEPTAGPPLDDPGDSGYEYVVVKESYQGEIAIRNLQIQLADYHAAVSAEELGELVYHEYAGDDGIFCPDPLPAEVGSVAVCEATWTDEDGAEQDAWFTAEVLTVTGDEAEVGMAHHLEEPDGTPAVA